MFKFYFQKRPIANDLKTCWHWLEELISSEAYTLDYLEEYLDSEFYWCLFFMGMGDYLQSQEAECLQWQNVSIQKGFHKGF